MAITEKTLLELRTLARNMSDQNDSDFVSNAEFNVYINLGIRQFYDKLAEVHGQEFLLKQTTFPITQPKVVYDLPDDLHVIKGVEYSTSPFDSSPVDPSLVSTDVFEREANRQVQVMLPYDFRERHDFGGWPADDFFGRPLRYRVFTEQVGTELEALEYRNRLRINEAANGYIAVWYIPEPPTLSEDTDTAPFWNGYEVYPAIYAAKMALQKEESDATAMEAELQAMHRRLETMAANRDGGSPGRVAEPSYHRWWKRS
jgi:hypothetical protein